MEDGASFAPPHLPPVDAYIPLAGEPYGPWMGSQAVAAFRACLPDTYDGSNLPYRLGNCLHQLESIFLSCDFDTTEWTRLAAIQLVGEAMECCRATSSHTFSYACFTATPACYLLYDCEIGGYASLAMDGLRGRGTRELSSDGDACIVDAPAKWDMPRL
ncbi:hypothetical protein TIFTF001_035783 [Ficus carica]|uniref:Uncharacterized protein n=1 Tax=Ficus carica TaxID=3494 RepID=A0AA88JAI8_FICCA|nr:hypothetical protein TIFTF001_035783 [Ficus carica]